MIITLTPEIERLINEELQSGHYHSAEEVIQRALQPYVSKSRPHQTNLQSARKLPLVYENCATA